jgi:hypothetical protein
LSRREASGGWNWVERRDKRAQESAGRRLGMAKRGRRERRNNSSNRYVIDQVCMLTEGWKNGMRMARRIKLSKPRRRPRKPLIQSRSTRGGINETESSAKRDVEKKKGGLMVGVL